MGDMVSALEWATLLFSLMGPCLLLFASRYVGRRSLLTDFAAVAGLLVIVGLGVPLFNGEIVFNPHIVEGRVVAFEFSPLGNLLAFLPAGYFAWSLILFWQERHETGESYLALGVFAMLAGMAGVFILPNWPIVSFASPIGMGILGFGVVSRQLFNPLRELTAELEQKIAERTRALQDAAAKLETANRSLSHRTAQLEASALVMREATAIRDVNQLFDVTVHLISERFGFYHTGIFILDDQDEYMVLRAASSEDGQRMLSQGHRLRVGQEGIVGYVAEFGAPRIALDVSNDAVFFENRDLPETRSEMALPLKMRGQVIGVLDVQSKEEAAFTDEDLATLQILADQVTLVIENARLLEETENRLREIETVLGRQIRKGWGQEAVKRPRWGYFYDGADVGRLAERTTKVTPQLTVPLQVRGQKIGNLNLVLGDRFPTSEDEILAQVIADQTGQAMERARLYQDTQSRAVREQMRREITDTMRQAVNIDALMKVTVQSLTSALGAEGAFVHLSVDPTLEDDQGENEE
jgi:GAF domain-containing protein